MKKVVIHTDGACEGNPGPGGWAAVLTYEGRERDVAGGNPATTNNRMEIMAAIGALRALKEPCEVELLTDSIYLKKGISEWIDGWKRKGWQTSTKQPVKNTDLWQELDTLRQPHRIEWKWLKGHAGHALNERCDRLAVAEIAKIKTTYPAAQRSELLAAFQQDRA